MHIEELQRKYQEMNVLEKDMRKLQNAIIRKINSTLKKVFGEGIVAAYSYPALTRLNGMYITTTRRLNNKEKFSLHTGEDITLFSEEPSANDFPLLYELIIKHLKDHGIELGFGATSLRVSFKDAVKVNDALTKAFAKEVTNET